VSRRTERLNRAIQQEISRLLEKEINDPRLTSFISVTAVSISDDLRHVRVSVSVMGDETSREQALAGFRAASGFIRKTVASNLRMRHAPEFEFAYDNSIEQAAAVLKLIERVSDNP